MADNPLPMEQSPLMVAGVPMTALLYDTEREGGFRVVVRDESDAIQFDTKDCVSLGDATYRVQEWIRSMEDAWNY